MAIIIAAITFGCSAEKRTLLTDQAKTATGNTMAKMPKNYLRYSDSFASAGQPNEDYLQFLAEQGVDIVINIAPHSVKGALENEEQTVVDSGMQYLNIPVIWDDPTQGDVESFLAFMQQHQESHIFLHCQLNMRASAFAFLHRVINLQNEPADAAKDMLTIWTPNSTWTELVNTALSNHQISYQIKK